MMYSLIGDQYLDVAHVRVTFACRVRSPGPQDTFGHLQDEQHSVKELVAACSIL